MSVTSITTIRNGGNLSRHEMLEWMNDKVEGHIKRIEDLCTGVAYCRLMGTIFPGSINMKRVKMTPRHTFEYKHNLRLLQDAFNRLELEEQPFPIDLIIQGRFKHNFEFIQFFKKFYDSQIKSTPEERKVLAPKNSFKASRVPSRIIKASFKTKSAVVEEDLESQNVLYEDALPEDPEDIKDLEQDIRAKWIMKANKVPQGPEAELMEKLINERDSAYHKLILIEWELSRIDGNELEGIPSLILDVLKAPKMPDQKGDAKDVAPQ